MGVENPHITVIIPCKNNERSIARTLEAVFSQTLKPTEVIVVDGHSTDNTVKIAKELGAKVLYEEYRTRAGAIKVGIGQATGDFVATTDADCVPEKHWLENLFTVISASAAIAGVGGMVMNMDTEFSNTGSVKGEGFWIKGINAAQNTFIGSANSIQAKQIGVERNINSISGANCLYRKSFVSGQFGYNPNLKGCEDKELNRRIRRRGGILRYVPSAIVFHYHGRSVREFAKKMLMYGREAARARTIDLQAIPAFLMVAYLILFTGSLFFAPQLGVLFLAWPTCIYLTVVISATFIAALKEKTPGLVLSMPVGYCLIHFIYSFGFLRGLLQKPYSELEAYR